MLKLNDKEKCTFKNHLIFSAANGIVFGGLFLQAMIARKTLLSSNLIITFITMVWPVANLFSIYWGEYLQGREDRSKLFLIAGIFGRLSLILTFFIQTGTHFLMLLLIVYSFNALIIPIQTSIFQYNYTPKNRGILFGISQTFYAGLLLLSSIGFGRILDINENYFRFIYAGIGIIGFFGLLALRKVQVKIPEVSTGSKRHPIINPILTTIEVFKDNKPFFWYEIGYIIYGFGYLMVLPILPQFLVDKLQMTYTQISLARVAISYSGIALLAPFAGFIQGKLKPILFSGISFLILAFYPILINYSVFQDFINPITFVYIGFIVFAIGRAGVNVNWRIGSIFFARKRDSSMLQSVHVTLTGIRGIFAPLLGYFLMSTISDTAAFMVSSFMFLSASIVMFTAHRIYR